MLDEKDLQAIAQLLSQQKVEILGEMDTKLSAQKTEILGEMDTKLSAQETEILGEMDTKFSAQKKEMMSEVLVLMESEFTPKFNLLAEGQQALLDKVASKSRVEDLEDKVSFLESIVRRISKDLDELKKAN